jgi:D-lactate dehydrogenase
VRELGTPLTFRAAGTSLSGQALSDSVLVTAGRRLARHAHVCRRGGTITCNPGSSAPRPTARLAPLGRKIGPDPASASTRHARRHRRQQRQRHVLRHRAEQLSHPGRHAPRAGRRQRAGQPATRQPRRLCAQHPELLQGLATLAPQTLTTCRWPQRIRHKYRLKNTTGYGLNALLDFDDPVEILTHLMIGSEGTLGFISEISYHTVPEHPHKASALLLFGHAEAACQAVTQLKPAPVVAVELLDRASLRAVQDKPGMPAALLDLRCRRPRRC